MENSSFKKQAKSDIFKELYPIVNFYIRKGAKPASLKKYYKNNKRFNDILDDIKNKGINLVKDEAEYKKLVREILNEILDDFISKLKDDEYKYKQNSKMKHIKEFVETEKSEDSKLTTDFKAWDELFGKLAWKYKPMKSGEMWLDGEETYKELSKEFHLKKNEDLSTFQHILLSAGATFCLYKFVKGLYKEIKQKKMQSKFDAMTPKERDELQNEMGKKLIDVEYRILTRFTNEYFRNEGKVKFSEDYLFYIFELGDLMIKIDKRNKTIKWSNIEIVGPLAKFKVPNKEEFTEPFSISQEEIDQLITSLKEEENN